MKRLPIATQLTIGFGTLIAFLAAVVAFGIFKAGCVLVNTNPLYTPSEMAHQFL